MKTSSGTKQVIRLVDERFNLKEQSGGLQEYDDNYIVERIDAGGSVLFLKGAKMEEGDMSGAINEDVVRRQQIRETIKTHPNANANCSPNISRYFPCSLSTIMDNYRLYDKESVQKGKFAEMFEEEYHKKSYKVDAHNFTDGAYTRFLSDPKNACDRVQTATSQ